MLQKWLLAPNQWGNRLGKATPASPSGAPTVLKHPQLPRLFLREEMRKDDFNTITGRCNIKYLPSGALQSSCMKFICTVTPINTRCPKVNKV